MFKALLSLCFVLLPFVSMGQYFRFPITKILKYEATSDQYYLTFKVRKPDFYENIDILLGKSKEEAAERIKEFQEIFDETKFMSMKISTVLFDSKMGYNVLCAPSKTYIGKFIFMNVVNDMGLSKVTDAQLRKALKKLAEFDEEMADASIRLANVLMK